MARETIAKVKADFESRLTELERRLGEISETHVAKSEVAEVARRYAEENGWCDEVDDALEELGITPKTYRVEVTIRYVFSDYRGPVDEDDILANLDYSGTTLDNDYAIDDYIEGVKVTEG